MAQPIRLGELLVRAGVLSERDLGRALEEQKRWGGRLGTTLVRMGVLTEDLLVKALARQLNMPRANLDAISVPAAVLTRLERSFCEQHLLVPLAYDQARRTLMVGVADPANVVALDDLTRTLGVRIEPYLGGETAIRRAIGRLYGGEVATSGGPDERLRLVNNQGESMDNQAPVVDPGYARPPSSPGLPRPPTGPSYALPNTGTFNVPVSGGFPSPPQTGSEARVAELADLAHKQTRALQALVELLIERGVLTREEYLAWLSRR